MLTTEVTEQEIEAAEKLSSEREFDASLALLENLLTRARDEETRMRLLYDVVTCSTWLNRVETLNKAAQELKQLPAYDVSHIFVQKTQARAYIDLGRPQEALDLINANLESEVLQDQDFRGWRYEHLFWKGRSLLRLARYDDALREFDAARDLYPEGEFEADMLIERANCLLVLDRYDEAYDCASKVLTLGDEEMATLAMQYMAECRMWQSRIPGALELYTAIQKRLPCSVVQEERIQKGIRNAMTYLERGRPQGKPS